MSEPNTPDPQPADSSEYTQADLEVVGTLLGDVTEIEPREKLEMTRTVQLKEDLYLIDHTLGGRDASAVDDAHHGQPIMPMAVNVETMAQVARLLHPDLRVVGFRSVQLRRWIPVYEEPTTLRIRARTIEAPEDFDAPVSPDTPVRVRIDIFDQGSDVRQGGGKKPSCRGEVLLASSYAESPEAAPLDLSDGEPSPIGPVEMYKTDNRLFHGPVFQGVTAVGRYSPAGIEGELTVPPRTGLFARVDNPRFETDPVIIDASTHLLGTWHLVQSDREGRVVFPVQLGDVDLFGPSPEPGARFGCRVTVEKIDARQAQHKIDIFSLDDGRVWCRIDPATYWRFYWPLEFVDFYRRHNEQLLASDWRVELASVVGTGSQSDEELVLGGGVAWSDDPAKWRAMMIKVQPERTETTLRAVDARVILSPDEWQFYQELEKSEDFEEQESIDWLYGRIAAKDAIRSLWKERTGESLFPADIEVLPDDLGYPMAVARWAEDVELPRVSIATDGDLSVAVADWDALVGVDMLSLGAVDAEFEQTYLHAKDRELLDSIAGPTGEPSDEPTLRQHLAARMWCAKSALVRLFHVGILEGVEAAAVVDQIDLLTGRVILCGGSEICWLLSGGEDEIEPPLFEAATTQVGERVIATVRIELK